MPALTITIPDAASLPTTVAKLLNALSGVVVEVSANGASADYLVTSAAETDDGNSVNLLAHPWDGALNGPRRDTTSIIPLDLIESIEVC